MDPQIRIAIANDQAILRDGLKALIAAHSTFQIAGEACSVAGAVAHAERTKPDILLLEFSAPGFFSLEVLQALRDARNPARTILLTSEIADEEIARAFSLGARGLVNKESPLSVLLKCIKVVMEGQYWIGLQSYAGLAEISRKYGSATKKESSPNYGLTTRELDVIRAVVLGCANKEIAAKLSISEQTVKHHLTNIFDKLGVYSRLELTFFVLHHKIVE
jgi:two-component system, NarL family, nitrate/nitrite response regulator NarL